MKSPPQFNVYMQRRGVTVLEVLFATFVVIVGLLGIASLITVAGRDAREAEAHSVSQSFSQSSLANFFARGLEEPNAFDSTNSGFDWRHLNDSTGAYSPVSIDSISADNSFANVASSQVVIPKRYQAFCIDPLFLTSFDVAQRISATSSLGNTVLHKDGYRLTVFPYFQDGHNPLTDPFYNGGSAIEPWPAQPRMKRVSLKGNTSGEIGFKFAQTIFQSLDDISFTVSDSDGTEFASRNFRMSNGNLYEAGKPVPSGVTLDRAENKGLFSWMATLWPVADNVFDQTDHTNRYLLSIVIFDRRDLSFVPPPTLSSDPPLPSGRPEEKPTGERIAWAHGLSGNLANGTGRIRLIANAATADNVSVGDWVLLSRFDLDSSSNPFPSFGWFRIIAASQESVFDTTANLAATTPFGLSAGVSQWSRDVVLDGGNFAMLPAPAGVASDSPVTATLLRNVVTVVQKEITLDISN